MISRGRGFHFRPQKSHKIECAIRSCFYCNLCDFLSFWISMLESKWDQNRQFCPCWSLGVSHGSPGHRFGASGEHFASMLVPCWLHDESLADVLLHFWNNFKVCLSCILSIVFMIKNNDNEARDMELVAIDHPITGGSDPAIPPITIFWGVFLFNQIV